MNARSVITITTVGLLALGAATAVGQSNLITPTSINGAETGQTRAKYRAAFGTARTDYLEGGMVRMVFEGSTTEVYLGTAKKGKAIITANAAYKTAGGVGPCSTFASLKAAIPAVARAGGADKRLWKSGRLWFRVENDAGTADLTTATVRAVMLVATPPPAMKKAFIGNTGLNCGAPASP